MPNTYTQIYIHYVFATEVRSRLLAEERQKELYDYSAGIIKELNCFLQCIGGMEDHIHILVGLHPTLSVSEFAQKVKANTSKFINKKAWLIGKFSWQKGFGAFSVSQSGLGEVRNYIKNQKEHHRGQSFADEYQTLLTRYRIDFDKKYLFHEQEI
ncbi:MAG: IS200/IS605 family transposase [Candidatus Cloacimonadaceae bacterium]|jgi:REP element-mobilizing transposase RayT|nr:IS200/IS605 family transposase [Candidatus Cloacimonadota bacterium]MDY0127450.1 IS200/IS605 family transposase [Candidatus Cloacimonadaceae bacterium]